MKKKKNSIYSVSSYLAMYKPNLIEKFIKKYSKENDWVYDPFSGRGTTLFVCRKTKRNFIGSDLSPYAFILSKFQSLKLKKETIIKKITFLEKIYFLNKEKYLNWIDEEKHKELLYFYHKETFSMLLFFRDYVSKKWFNNWEKITPVDCALLAFACGLMHGQMKKDKTTSYFSLTCPNTISMSPNYVKNYTIRKNLLIPNVNIFTNLINRVNLKYNESLSIKNNKFTVKLHDVNKELSFLKDESIDFVLTSPPYLNLINYVDSNWLRFWLLGYDERRTLKKHVRLSDNLNLNNYINFLTSFLNNIYSKIKKNAHLCLVVADFKKYDFLDDIWVKIKENIKFTFVKAINDDYKKSKKITYMLKKASGIKREKILILKK